MVKGLSKKYDTRWAVAGISFEVKKGEVLVLLGTSGCGKTTTLKMINRLVEPSKGEISIDGEDIKSKEIHLLRRKIGYVIQETGLFPHYTIEKNIGVVPELLGWPKNHIVDRTDELLELIGLDPSIKKRMPNELSGGQRQRVGLARALAADPAVVLLDEPFGALDPITRSEMQREFLQLEGALEKAMVLVTHDVVEAVKLADKICLMDKGKVQQMGSARELIFKPRNSFVKSFFEEKLFEIEPLIINLKDLVIGLNESNENNAIEVKASMSVLDAAKKGQPIQFYFEGKNYFIENIMATYYKLRKQIINQWDND